VADQQGVHPPGPSGSTSDEVVPVLQDDDRCRGDPLSPLHESVVTLLALSTPPNAEYRNG
jgi:hypothetical protein